MIKKILHFLFIYPLTRRWYCILLFPFCLQAQDSIPKVSLQEYYKFKRETDKNIKSIQLNLDLCQQRYHKGAGLLIAGTILSAVAVPMYFFDLPVVGAIGNGIGGILSLSGALTMMSSHKFIGRAGKRIETEEEK